MYFLDPSKTVTSLYPTCHLSKITSLTDDVIDDLALLDQCYSWYHYDSEPFSEELTLLNVDLDETRFDVFGCQQ